MAAGFLVLAQFACGCPDNEWIRFDVMPNDVEATDRGTFALWTEYDNSEFVHLSYARRFDTLGGEGGDPASLSILAGDLAIGSRSELAVGVQAPPYAPPAPRDFLARRMRDGVVEGDVITLASQVSSGQVVFGGQRFHAVWLSGEGGATSAWTRTIDEDGTLGAPVELDIPSPGGSRGGAYLDLIAWANTTVAVVTISSCPEDPQYGCDYQLWMVQLDADGTASSAVIHDARLGDVEGLGAFDVGTGQPALVVLDSLGLPTAPYDMGAYAYDLGNWGAEPTVIPLETTSARAVGYGPSGMVVVSDGRYMLLGPGLVMGELPGAGSPGSDPMAVLPWIQHPAGVWLTATQTDSGRDIGDDDAYQFNIDTIGATDGARTVVATDHDSYFEAAVCRNW